MNTVLNMPENYNAMRAEIVEVLKAARAAAARNVNSISESAGCVEVDFSTIYRT
jgi:hypothetical protein